MQGTIFSIEEFSTFDGPGIRTTVFFKGCPLRCVWCHNPEGQQFSVEYVKNVGACLHCGLCEDSLGVRGGECFLTEESVKACPHRFVQKCGETYEAEILAKKILKNQNILIQSSGGVTFSGGEPLAQADFLKECCIFLKGKLHRALQTSGFADCKIFENCLEEIDFVLYDLKLMDNGLHEKYCGQGNETIKENYRILINSGVDFITRVPLIPSITDTEENLLAIAEFISSLGVKYVELLPYNRLAGAKYDALLRTYAPEFNEKAEVNLGLSIFEKFGIKPKKSKKRRKV